MRNGEALPSGPVTPQEAASTAVTGPEQVPAQVTEEPADPAPGGGAPGEGTPDGRRRAGTAAARPRMVLTFTLPGLEPADIRAAVIRAFRATPVQRRLPVPRLVRAGSLITLMVLWAVAAGGAVVPSLTKPVEAVAEPAPTEPVVVEPSAEPSPSVQPSISPAPTGPARPADQFATWAAQISPKAQVPVVALQAYGYAEWVTSQTRPACKLQWTTLAAIGKVESDHGRGGGAVLDDRGRSTPPIIGPALDGTRKLKKIVDTDAGALDADKKWDHAVGPMQFLPTTWRGFAVDADGDQLADPFDLDDAALGAAYYLCSSGKDMSVVANWKAVVLTYNNVGAYLEKVYETAQAYGQRSRP